MTGELGVVRCFRKRYPTSNMSILRTCFPNMNESNSSKASVAKASHSRAIVCSRFKLTYGIHIELQVINLHPSAPFSCIGLDPTQGIIHRNAGDRKAKDSP